MRTARRTFTVVALAVNAACGDRDSDAAPASYASSVTWDTTRIAIVTQRDTVPLRVELARTRDQQTMGLMERRQLAADAGMLFVYDSLQPADAGFWMYRTRIPLDIAFADSGGVIRSIRTMAPCETTIPEGCPIYPAEVPYQYALEANAGFFRQRNVAVGDRILLANIPRQE